jgi:hypothetical protein
VTGSIIIIEGTDGVGKTTFANALAAARGSRTAVFHAGPPKNKAFVNEYILPLVIARDGWTCICDRWHLGEPVWSDVFGREPILKYEQLHVVEKRLQALEVPINTVYMVRDQMDIEDELVRRDDGAVGPAVQALELYEKALKYSMFWWMQLTLPEAMEGLGNGSILHDAS